MQYEYNKLRGRIVEKYGTLGAFSKVLGLSDVSVSRKMQGKTSFSQGDIVEWSKLLDIPSSDIPNYFFT